MFVPGQGHCMRKPLITLLPYVAVLFLAGLLLTGHGYGSAFAESFPVRSIRMVVPYGAGSGTDVMARAVVRFLEETIGQKVVVINKPGANGSIGTAEVAAARPDGYTALMLLSSDYMLTRLLSKDPGFTCDDFTLVGSFNDTANCVVVKKNSQFKTFTELVEYARANPGKVTVSTSGLSHVFLGAMIGQVTGTKFSTITYSGNGESLSALLGGHVEAAILDRRFVKQAAQNGCTALTVAGEERYAMLPELPTMRELGYDIIDSQRSILAVPSGVPQEVVDVLIKAVTDFSNTRAFDETLVALDEVPKIETGNTLTAWFKRQYDFFANVVEADRERFPVK